MEIQDLYYPQSEYIETSSGNKVSRNSVLAGSQNIVLNGRCIVQSDCVLRGDLAQIRMGKYSILKKNSVLHPGVKTLSKGINFFPLNIGECVMIEENSVISATQIGSFSYIGKNCILGSHCIVKEYTWLLDGSVLPDESTAASFRVYSGNPAVPIAELTETIHEQMTEMTKTYYKRYFADTKK